MTMSDRAALTMVSQTQGATMLVTHRDGSLLLATYAVVDGVAVWLDAYERDALVWPDSDVAAVALPDCRQCQAGDHAHCRGDVGTIFDPCDCGDWRDHEGGLLIMIVKD